MLKNIPVNTVIDPMLLFINEITSPGDSLINVQEGVYQAKSFNIESTYFNKNDIYTYNHPKVRALEKEASLKLEKEECTFQEMIEATKEYGSSYGVADNLEQVLEKFKDKVESPDKNYVILMTLVERKDQSEDGGWRFHKWGPYIGDHEIEYEYLYDQKDMDSVYVYHIYRVVS